MLSARDEKKILHRITRQLESDLVGSQVVSDRGMPASGDQSMRPTAAQLRETLPVVKRQAYLRNAIQRLGGYLVRYDRGQKYKATIGSRIYVGTFAEVFDQVAPLILRRLEPCL